MKKILATILATTMLIGGAISAYAINTNVPREHTQEEIEQIQSNNEKIEKEFNSLTQFGDNKLFNSNDIPPIMRAIDRRLLNVPVYKQRDNYSCSLACTQMVLDYVGNKYMSQDKIASKTGYTTVGLSTDAIAAFLNREIAPNTYEYANINNVNMENSIIIGIEHDKPTICQTWTTELDDKYNFSSGHYVVAAGYEAGFSGSSSVAKVTYIDPFENGSGSLGYNTISMSKLKRAIRANPSSYIVRPVI